MSKLSHYDRYAKLLQFILPSMKDDTKKIMINIVIALYLSGTISGDELTESDTRLIKATYAAIESDPEKRQAAYDLIQNTDRLSVRHG